ncbi:endolytic transglycosylase MltG [Brucepastera parasyntrophica]|uniref:endolytic transglycosylase MltG n=1 Tax=Brucepastera parasyntrophica TaxID=2880008 RepID=UPI00210AA53B|nr:endolytic transglycosylase MltG [Brucepastera parasyntrophica]
MYEKVILASIVEREYQIREEAPLIASVFANRLKIGMGLQSCATIEYIITEIQGLPHPVRLYDRDLEIRSDYNTYLWAGLPPSPISNPGLIALNAAFNPAKTNYLYFRLTDSESGAHTFTRSLDEHVSAGRNLTVKRAAGN